MDIMLILQFIVLLGGIYLGVKLGGMGIGYAGGVGVIVLTLVLGMKTEMKHIPTDVILIIASVISAISAMQVAGGLDWLVQQAEKILRKNPKQINYLAPIVFTVRLCVWDRTGICATSWLMDKVTLVLSMVTLLLRCVILSAASQRWVSTLWTISRKIRLTWSTTSTIRCANQL